MVSPNSDVASEDSEASRRSGYEPITSVDTMTTPPTYVVRETSDGRLVNDSFGVEWPERPKYGRYSLKVYQRNKRGDKGRAKRHRKRHRRHRQSSRLKDHSHQMNGDSDESFQRASIRKYHRPLSSRRDDNDNDESNGIVKDNTATNSSHKPRSHSTKPLLRNAKAASPSARSKRNLPKEESDDYLFVGALTSSAVSDLLKPNDFRIYYQMPATSNVVVPVHIPLCLAYRSTLGKVFHFPVICTIDDETGKQEWRVQYGDPRSASFASLPALVRYHKIYSYMDPKTGVIDTFPVWRGTVIDVDDFDFEY